MSVYKLKFIIVILMLTSKLYKVVFSHKVYSQLLVSFYTPRQWPIEMVGVQYVCIIRVILKSSFVLLIIYSLRWYLYSRLIFMCRYSSQTRRHWWFVLDCILCNAVKLYMCEYLCAGWLFLAKVWYACQEWLRILVSMLTYLYICF